MAIPPLRMFRNLPVVPVTRVHQHIAQGGPIWPDFDQQRSLRHCRANAPVDLAPDPPKSLRDLPGDHIWGGFLDSHFGHFVADHLPRLPAALHERPSDPVLFTVDPGVTRDTLPGWVWQVFDWIGLAADRVHLVTDPVRVAVLWVGAQAEMLPQGPPSSEYLGLIAHWASGLDPIPSKHLYVGRVGLPQKGGGGHAGEGYVAQALTQLGVILLDPVQATLRQQMAAYAGAETILFAEGSALHGRQLLGYCAQDIHVLRRRPGRSMAQGQLTPRCRSLTYHDVGGDRLMPYWKSGTARPDPALCFYDVATLTGLLRNLGLDLGPVWNDAAFASAVAADISGWLEVWQPDKQHLADYDSTLSKLGLTRKAR